MPGTIVAVHTNVAVALLVLCMLAGSTARADVYDELYAHMHQPGLVAVVERPAQPAQQEDEVRPTWLPPTQRAGAETPPRTQTPMPAQHEAAETTPPPPSAATFRQDILVAAREHDVPAALIHAIISVESRWNPNAVSRKGAMGLMQLMPATAAMLGIIDAFDPRENVLGGTRYLSKLIRQFKGDLRLAVAAYNAGPAAVLRRRAMQAFPETRHYVRRVLSRYRFARQLYEE